MPLTDPFARFVSSVAQHGVGAPLFFFSREERAIQAGSYQFTTRVLRWRREKRFF